ncbi:MAG: ComF family protein [Clostridia bacterium]|nr:ComF family protein [Clostridia bacterium]
MKLREWIEKLKDKWQKVGYTCDVCGGEVFDYPTPRLCTDCQAVLIKNERFACEKCGRAAVTEGICAACKAEMPAFDKGFSPYVYHGEVAGVVNRLKRGEAFLSLFFAEEMAKKIMQSGIDLNGAVVTFVPLDNRKRRTRGYDQAEKLAKEIAKLTGLPMEKLLLCLGKSEQQKELTRLERRKNVEGMYRVVERKRAKGKTVLLVDDIMTTGATGNECAVRLKKAGADKVYFVTAAALPERK